MTNIAGEGAGRGEAQAKSRRRRWWGWLIGMSLAAICGGAILRSIWPSGNRIGEELSPGFAIAASAFLLIVGACVVFIYHRIIDEQEERAALWGMTIGFYLLSAGSMIWFLLASAHLVTFASFPVIWIASSIAALATQLWNQHK